MRAFLCFDGSADGLRLSRLRTTARLDSSLDHWDRLVNERARVRQSYDNQLTLTMRQRNELVT